MVTLILRMTKTRKACHPVILLPFTPPTQTPGQCTESPPSHLTWKAWVKVTLRNTFLLSSCTFMYFFLYRFVLCSHCTLFGFPFLDLNLIGGYGFHFCHFMWPWNQNVCEEDWFQARESPLKITDMDKPKTNETLKLQIMKHNIVSVQNT